MGGVDSFLAARNLLFELRNDYEAAYERFRWPELDEFNWATDYFDSLADQIGDRIALHVVEEDGSSQALSYAEMTARSNQVANYLRELGIGRGDRMLVVLGNQVALWETFLAAMKVGAVIIPATTLLAPTDLKDRLERGQVRVVVAAASQAAKFEGLADGVIKVAVGDPGDPVPGGWRAYGEYASAPTSFSPDGPTKANDPLLLYFTSGTTALPKLVEHTHASYPVGHLTTMYWIGLMPGDVHLNLSSPGWAKHAWSNIFAPFNAEATSLVFNYERFSASALFKVLSDFSVTTFCAPPTVWRMMIQADLSQAHTSLRELVSAGEPLNPEVIEQVRRQWGITVRDGYGQTETTLQIGNSPGQLVKPGSMGRPMPGYRIELVDPQTNELVEEGEIAIVLEDRPMALMTGYRDDPSLTDQAMRGGYYHTGDVASKDSDGYLTYVGRADDVFKASDYRISPFELESILVEHEAVAEAAVVPSPDPVRLSVPKAYIALASGWQPDETTARAIFAHVASSMAPFKRVRRIEFYDLPKTISGKIRRVELRKREEVLHPSDSPLGKAEGEWWESDFPDLRQTST
ncbi:MAG: AMP-binding protein [Actinobacteria bacterium]|jgi:acetyl-CoA synthetase|nr:AMP-binding protein [Actinomycetota bacterium]MCL6094312.1 AMP-binding protein [Actinomycetota bacterium]